MLADRDTRIAAIEAALRAQDAALRENRGLIDAKVSTDAEPWGAEADHHSFLNRLKRLDAALRLAREAMPDLEK